jgi:hypothetical protein
MAVWIGIDSAANMKDRAELRRQWKPQAPEREVGWTVPKRESRGLRPGVLIYVVLTAGFDRGIAAEDYVEHTRVVSAFPFSVRKYSGISYRAPH